MTTSDERYVEMRDFLTENLARRLTEKELHFVNWLADYEMTTYDQVMAFFAELVSCGRVPESELDKLPE